MDALDQACQTQNAGGRTLIFGHEKNVSGTQIEEYAVEHKILFETKISFLNFFLSFLAKDLTNFVKFC